MKKLAIGAVVVLVLIVGGLVLASRGAAPPPPSTPGGEKTLEIGLTAKGSVLPVKQAKLAFKSAAIVELVRVKAGDKVTRGQPLASLETADLKLQVRSAEDALAVSEALLAQSKAEARPEEVEAAEASYAGALARYTETVAGPKDADIKAAEATLEAAKERLAQVESGAGAEDLTVQSALDAARAKLAQLKSSPKPEDVRAAELTRDQAKLTLWSAQISRDGVKGNGLLPEYMGKSEDAKVAAAETAVLIAETELTKLKAGPAPEDLAAAETAVQQAQAQLDSRRATSSATVASARAAVESAQARLDQLNAGPTEADVQGAKSTLASARANVETKKKGASQAEIEVNMARVEQSRTAVEQAKLALANATLQAPFDGTVVNVAVREGETAAPGSVAITFGDLSGFRIETTDLDEASATRIQVGQAVEVTINAFDNKVLPGKVVSIAPVATITQSGDANYVATIELDNQDESLRWGMTTKVDFGVIK